MVSRAALSRSPRELPGLAVADERVGRLMALNIYLDGMTSASSPVGTVAYTTPGSAPATPRSSTIRTGSIGGRRSPLCQALRTRRRPLLPPSSDDGPGSSGRAFWYPRTVVVYCIAAYKRPSQTRRLIHRLLTDDPSCRVVLHYDQRQGRQDLRELTDPRITIVPERTLCWGTFGWSNCSWK